MIFHITHLHNNLIPQASIHRSGSYKLLILTKKLILISINDDESQGKKGK